VGNNSDESNRELPLKSLDNEKGVDFSNAREGRNELDFPKVGEGSKPSDLVKKKEEAKVALPRNTWLLSNSMDLTKTALLLINEDTETLHVPEKRDDLELDKLSVRRFEEPKGFDLENFPDAKKRDDVRNTGLLDNFGVPEKRIDAVNEEGGDCNTVNTSVGNGLNPTTRQLFDIVHTRLNVFET
jgi:hypothetical protein